MYPHGHRRPKAARSQVRQGGTVNAARAWLTLAAALVAVHLMAACGNNTVATSGPGGSTNSKNGTAPVVACEPFLPAAPCTTYVSVSGRDGSGELPWTAQGTTTVQLESVDTGFQLTLVTPCGPLSGHVTRTGSALTPGPIGVGANGFADGATGGCAGGQKLWLLDFLKKPFEVAYNEGQLTWTNDKGSLVFKPR